MFTIVTRTKLLEQRERAAATLTRYVLARLTRSWFLLWSRPWLWQGRALLWPHSVAMRVSWSVLRVAHAGSIIFGRPVRPNSAWQHMLVAAARRGEMWPDPPSSGVMYVLHSRSRVLNDAYRFTL